MGVGETLASGDKRARASGSSCEQTVHPPLTPGRSSPTPQARGLCLFRAADLGCLQYPPPPATPSAPASPPGQASPILHLFLSIPHLGPRPQPGGSRQVARRDPRQSRSGGVRQRRKELSSAAPGLSPAQPTATPPPESPRTLASPVPQAPQACLGVTQGTCDVRVLLALGDGGPGQDGR